MSKLSYFSNVGIQDYSRLGLVWNLFANFGKSTKEEILRQSRSGYVDRFDFSDDLITKGTAGQINLTQDTFNIAGYDYYLKNYKALHKKAKLQKEVFLVNEIDKGNSEDTADGYGEFSENRITQSVEEETELDVLERDMDYLYSWGLFPTWAKTLEKQGYSLVYLLLAVIEGTVESQKNLAYLCEVNEGLREWVESVFIPDKMEEIVTRLNEFKEVGAFV